MENQRVKTAFELAMEKVAEMPKLNSQEIKAEYKKESLAKGTSIAQRYLLNLHRKTDIRNEIASLNPEQQIHARHSALERLSLELNLGNPEISRHIFDGIAALNPNVTTNAALKRYNNVINDFHVELRAAYAAMEKDGVKRLRKEGISGTAIKPNLKSQHSWQSKQAELTVSHTSILHHFQKSLLP